MNSTAVVQRLHTAQVGGSNPPSSTTLWVLSLKAEHPPYKWDTAERYRQDLPISNAPLVKLDITQVYET